MNQLEALLPLLNLDRLPRTGWLQRGVPSPESIAAHSLGTALVALSLGPRISPVLNLDRAVALAVVHDAPEAWVTDIPRTAAQLLPAGAKAEAEARAARGLLAPLSAAALDRYTEFTAGETREARFAHLCDSLHLGVRLVGYLRAGQRGLEEFRTGLAELDCDEFPPCEELRRQILAAIDTVTP